MNEEKIIKILNKVGITNIQVYINNEFSNFPIFYKKKYAIYECLFNDSQKSASIAVFINQLNSKFDISEFVSNYLYLKNNFSKDIIMGIDNLSGFHKEQLIKAQIPFVIFETNNLFIPFLGMYLTDKNYIDKIDFYSKPFTPTEQSIFLLMIYAPLKRMNYIDPIWILKNSKISKPSVYRMLDKLNNDHIFLDSDTNTYRNWNLTLRKTELWNKYENQLTSPILKKLFFESKLIDKLSEECDIYIGGLSALSILTNLSEDNKKTYVAFQSDFSKIVNILNSDNNSFVDRNEETYLDNYCELQIWKTAPINLENRLNYKGRFKLVDPLSLYLSIQKGSDPRIDSELSYLLEKAINGN